MEELNLLFGAGSTIELGSPSTKEITDQVEKELITFNQNGRKIDIKGFISNEKDRFGRQYNFEKLFFTIEKHLFSLSDLLIKLFNENKNNDEEFLKSNKCQNLRLLHFSCSTILAETEKIILRFTYSTTVNSQSSTVDGSYLQYFIKTLSRTFRLNIGTLNYDYVLENTCKDETFVDGYSFNQEDIGLFSTNNLYKTDNNRIFHLHGAYDFFLPDEKKSSYVIARDGCLKKRVLKQDDIKPTTTATAAIDKSNRFLSPLITGSEKIKKIVIAPFLEYHALYSHKLLTSPKLIIAGYSFNDDYINDVLNRFSSIHGSSRRIVIIDYFNQQEPGKSIFKSVWWDIPSLNTISLLTNTASFSEYNSTESPYISPDGCVRIYLTGMKSTLIQYGDEIVKFLNS